MENFDNQTYESLLGSGKNLGQRIRDWVRSRLEAWGQGAQKKRYVDEPFQMGIGLRVIASMSLLTKGHLLLKKTQQSQGISSLFCDGSQLIFSSYSTTFLSMKWPY